MEMRSFLRMHFGSDELALSGLDTKFPTGLARSPDFQDLLVHNKYCLAVRAIKLFKLLDKDQDDFVRVEDIMGIKRPPPEKPEIVEPETAPMVELPLPQVTSNEPLTFTWKVGDIEDGQRTQSGYFDAGQLHDLQLVLDTSGGKKMLGLRTRRRRNLRLSPLWNGWQHVPVEVYWDATKTEPFPLPGAPGDEVGFVILDDLEHKPEEVTMEFTEDGVIAKWPLQNFLTKMRDYPRGSSLTSESFHIFGADFRLRVFPNGAPNCNVLGAVTIGIEAAKGTFIEWAPQIGDRKAPLKLQQFTKDGFVDSPVPFPQPTSDELIICVELREPSPDKRVEKFGVVDNKVVKPTEKFAKAFLKDLIKF